MPSPTRLETRTDPPVALDGVFDDGQAQPGALDVLAGEAVRPVEPLEHVGRVAFPECPGRGRGP